MIGVYMNCDIVCGYRKLNGVCTSLFDIYFNLIERNIPVTFNLTIHPNGFYDMLYYKDEYPSIPYKKLMKYSFDTLIISSDFIGQDWDIFKNFKYKNLIIVDSTKIYIDYLKNNNVTSTRLNSIKNKTVLGNKFNSQFVDNDYYIWHHKFSNKRMKYLENKYAGRGDGVLYRINNSDTYSILDRHISYHLYNECFYHRYRSWDNGVTYVENIGKTIFEYLYMKKKVIYSPKNKTMDDGLTEYLSLFDIDDNVEQELHISKEELEDKLFMKDTDLLLDIINRR